MTKSKAIQTTELDDQIGFKLRLAQLAVFSDIIDALKGVDLRPVDLSALLLIEANPGLRQNVIGEKLKIARPNIVALIDLLAGKALVERVVDTTDRRANQLRLTQKGSDLLVEAKRAQDEHRKRVLKSLDGVDIEIFSKGLTQLAKLRR